MLMDIKTDMSWDDLVTQAQDRPAWKSRVKQLKLGAKGQQWALSAEVTKKKRKELKKEAKEPLKSRFTFAD